MTLEEIEGEDWGEPDYPSRLVIECYRLRRVPLEQLGVEDLRLLIGQSIGLEHLLPLAFDHLESDPWVSGAYYEGDLLKNVLGISDAFWHAQPQLKRRCDRIVEKALACWADATPEEAPWFDAGVLRRLEVWR